ncbi:YdeI/OmpD-associated family protein [soil metagenome]
MDITETLYVPTRGEWRAWLEAHFQSKGEVWLISYRVHTGIPSISYNDAVEEALCFGWIDSTRKGLDDERLAQRFSIRRPGAAYSQTNKERLARLRENGLLHPDNAAGLKDVRAEDFHIPEDIQAALQSDGAAWAFFQGTSLSYQRIRAAYVDHARKDTAEFEKRLAHLVAKCARGTPFGYGIERYY